MSAKAVSKINYGWVIAGAAFLLNIAVAAATLLNPMSVESRLTVLETHHGEQSRKLNDRRRYMNQITPAVVDLCSKDPECRAKYLPIDIPE